MLVKHWRAHGFKIVLFVDDGIGAAGSYKKCEEAARFVKMSIEKAGFIINEEKSSWIPTQKITWLGLEINTETFSLKIAGKRTTKVLEKIRIALETRVCSARQVSSIAGSIISQEIVLGPITGLFTRNMYGFITEQTRWDGKFRIPARVTEELSFWKENMVKLNFKSLVTPAAPVAVIPTVKSDASSVASGAVLKHRGETFIAHKNLSDSEQKQSSTWRELDAVLFTVRSFAPLLKNKNVDWATNNQAVPKIAAKGSSKPHLQDIARKLYYACRENAIALNIAWIPRSENTVADEISKFVDHDDWCTTEDFFNDLNATWGPYTVDRFANSKNAKLPRYNSLFWNPECEAVDAFSQDWGGERNWIVPPTMLIPRVIEHARACGAEGTLVVPYWESAAYWPLLRKGCNEYRHFVMAAKNFNCVEGILELGDYKNALLGSTRFNSPIVAIKFKF